MALLCAAQSHQKWFAWGLKPNAVFVLELMVSLHTLVAAKRSFNGALRTVAINAFEGQTYAFITMNSYTYLGKG